MEKQKKQLQDTYDECTEKEKAAAEKLAGSEAALENVKGPLNLRPKKRQGRHCFRLKTAKTGRRSISESSGRSEESRKCAETGRNPDQPLPAGDSGTEEVCGRSKNFLYRSNGNKTDDRI